MASDKRVNPLEITEDSLDVFQQYYPDQWFELEKAGFEKCATSLIGRIEGQATVYLELDHAKGRVLAWAWLSKEELYLGPSYEVRGPLDSAVARARHLIESTVAEEEVSGSAERHKTRQVRVQRVS